MILLFLYIVIVKSNELNVENYFVLDEIEITVNELEDVIFNCKSSNSFGAFTHKNLNVILNNSNQTDLDLPLNQMIGWKTPKTFIQTDKNLLLIKYTSLKDIGSYYCLIRIEFFNLIFTKSWFKSKSLINNLLNLYANCKKDEHKNCFAVYKFNLIVKKTLNRKLKSIYLTNDLINQCLIIKNGKKLAYNKRTLSRIALFLASSILILLIIYLIWLFRFSKRHTINENLGKNFFEQYKFVKKDTNIKIKQDFSSNQTQDFIQSKLKSEYNLQDKNKFKHEIKKKESFSNYNELEQKNLINKENEFVNNNKEVLVNDKDDLVSIKTKIKNDEINLDKNLFKLDDKLTFNENQTNLGDSYEIAGKNFLPKPISNEIKFTELEDKRIFFNEKEKKILSNEEKFSGNFFNKDEKKFEKFKNSFKEKKKNQTEEETLNFKVTDNLRKKKFNELKSFKQSEVKENTFFEKYDLDTRKKNNLKLELDSIDVLLKKQNLGDKNQKFDLNKLNLKRKFMCNFDFLPKKNFENAFHELKQTKLDDLKHVVKNEYDIESAISVKKRDKYILQTKGKFKIGQDQATKPLQFVFDIDPTDPQNC